MDVFRRNELEESYGDVRGGGNEDTVEGASIPKVYLARDEPDALHARIGEFDHSGRPGFRALFLERQGLDDLL